MFFTFCDLRRKITENRFPVWINIKLLFKLCNKGTDCYNELLVSSKIKNNEIFIVVVHD